MLERWRLGLGSSESGGNRRADRRGSLQRERFDRWHPRTSGRSFSTGASAASAGFATPEVDFTNVNRLVLGIETSCDDTGVAIVDFPSGRIIFEALASQYATHASFQGVVPKLAMRDHEKNLPVLLGQAEEVLSAVGGFSALGGVAATRGPGLAMCLRVGLKAGRDLAHVHNLPFVGVNHLEAHVLVPRLLSDCADEDVQVQKGSSSRGASPAASERALQYPFLVLLVSGGHCMLLLTKGVGDHVQLGSTLDDSLGEAYDKVARMLGLGWLSKAVAVAARLWRARARRNKTGAVPCLQNARRHSRSRDSRRLWCACATNGTDGEQERLAYRKKLKDTSKEWYGRRSWRYQPSRRCRFVSAGCVKHGTTRLRAEPLRKRGAGRGRWRAALSKSCGDHWRCRCESVPSRALAFHGEVV